METFETCVISRNLNENNESSNPLIATCKLMHVDTSSVFTLKFNQGSEGIQSKPHWYNLEEKTNVNRVDIVSQKIRYQLD